MGATTNPNAYQPLDPQTDPYPVFHWVTEVGPSIAKVIAAMFGFAAGVV